MTQVLGYADLEIIDRQRAADQTGTERAKKEDEVSVVFKRITTSVAGSTGDRENSAGVAVPSFASRFTEILEKKEFSTWKKVCELAELIWNCFKDMIKSKETPTEYVVIGEDCNPIVPDQRASLGEEIGSSLLRPPSADDLEPAIEDAVAAPLTEGVAAPLTEGVAAPLTEEAGEPARAIEAALIEAGADPIVPAVMRPRKNNSTLGSFGRYVIMYPLIASTVAYAAVLVSRREMPTRDSLLRDGETVRDVIKNAVQTIAIKVSDAYGAILAHTPEIPTRDSLVRGGEMVRGAMKNVVQASGRKFSDLFRTASPFNYKIKAEKIAPAVVDAVVEEIAQAVTPAAVNAVVEEIAQAVTPAAVNAVAEKIAPAVVDAVVEEIAQAATPAAQTYVGNANVMTTTALYNFFAFLRGDYRLNG